MEFPKHESLSSTLIKEKEAEGWTLAGQEGLRRFKLDDEAMFITVPFQTKEEISQKTLEKYRDQAKQQGLEIDVEVELIPKPPELFQGQPVVNKSQDTEEHLIFVRVKK